MKKVIAAAVVSLLAASPVMAWNPLKDAAEQVEQGVTTQAEQTAAQQTENGTAAAADLTIDAKRKALGSLAEGKSDAEVSTLFDQQVGKGKDLLNQAAAAQQDGGAALKAAAGEKAAEATQEQTRQATQKGFEALNKALGQ